VLGLVWFRLFAWLSTPLTLLIFAQQISWVWDETTFGESWGLLGIYFAGPIVCLILTVVAFHYACEEQKESSRFSLTLVMATVGLILSVISNITCLPVFLYGFLIHSRWWT